MAENIFKDILLAGYLIWDLDFLLFERRHNITTLLQEPHLVGAGTSGESSTGSGTASSPSSLNVEGSYVPRLAIGNGDGREKDQSL